MAIDEAKLNEFLGKAVGDLGAAVSATLVLVGDRLGLYRALAAESLTSEELAAKTSTSERYVREWLGNQGAAGYVEFDPDTGTWSMSPEQAACLADPSGPVDMPGAYNIVEATFHALAHTLDNFKSGAGMEWGEHHPCLFEGTERFFRAGYNTNLIGAWLPALDGVVDKLARGAKVADVGCGHGASTILMALTYPDSEFVGYDYHDESIGVATEKAAAAGATNARFEVADAVGYAGKDFVILRRQPPAAGEYAPFFREVEVRTIALGGGIYHAVLGRDFRYEPYRAEVLAVIKERFYRIPRGLPVLRCYFFERYFAQ